MTTPVGISPAPILQFFNNAGQPNAGGKILTQVGGVNYPTYQDSAGNTPLPNPIPLNSRGEVSNSSGQSCQLFLASGAVYTFTMYDASNNQINQAQYVAGSVSVAGLGATTGASLVGTADGSTLAQLLLSSLGHVITSIAALRTLSKLDYTQAFVTGYYASGDGGGGAYYYDPTDTTSADNGGTIIVAGDGGRWKLIDTTYLTVKTFGAKGDGTTDDSAAVTAANTYAMSIGVALHFPHGTYILKASYTLYINQTSWIGDNATLDFTGLTGTGFALTLDSTSSYANQAQQIRYALQGIKLHGGTSTARGTASGVFIGNSAGNAYVSVFSIDTFAIEGFATNLSFGSNAWKVRLSNGMIRWGAITVPSGLTNFGENMEAENVFFADTDTFSPTPSIQLGEWHFKQCSFDNFEIDISAGANVFFHGCHFEKPGVDPVLNSYLRLTGGQNTTVRVSDSEIVGGYSSITKAPFYVDDTITSGGLFFNGCVFPNSANINLSAETRTDKLLFEDFFTCGKGRATFTDCRTSFISSISNPSGCTSSYNANLVSNGNLVTAAVPWTQMTGAAQPTPVITTDTNSPTGKVCTISSSATNTTVAWRTNKVPVTPGQAISAILIGGIFGLQTGDSAGFNILFEDAAGNLVTSNPSLAQTTSSNVVPYVTLYPNSTVVPDGATVAYIQLNFVTGATAATREWSIGMASLTLL